MLFPPSHGKLQRAVFVLAGMAILVIAFFALSTPLFNAPEEPTEEGRSEIRQALDLMTNARAYPNDEIPQAGYAQAHAYSKASLSKHNAERRWRALGPTNIGGRTLALALNPENPNTIYAGSASGGLWRSYTGGIGEQAWTYIPTGFPVLGVAAIAIAPDDSNTIYIGTGEVYGSDESFPGVAIRTTRGSYGIGLLKSTDGGVNWTKSIDWSLNQRRGVQKIRINPLRPQTVWAATTQGIYRSYNGGATWALVHDVVMATDLKINPQDTSVVFAAHGGMGSLDHGVYRTTNAGASWTKMNFGSNGPTSYFGKAMLAMSPSSPNVVYASVGNSDGLAVETKTWLLRTPDGGDSWDVVSEVDYSSFQGWYAHTVAVHPTNPNELWTVGQPFSPFYSTQGGIDLMAATEINRFNPATGVEGDAYPNLHYWADYHDIVYHPTNHDIIYFANDGGVFRTTDGGRTTENCNGGYQVTQFYNGFSNSPTDSAFAAGGFQDNNSAVYEGDPHWKRVGVGDGGWTAILDEDVYLTWQRMGILVQRDRGNDDPEFISPPGRETANFIAPFIVSPADQRTLYTASDRVFISKNKGNSWFAVNNTEPLDGNPALSMAGSAQSADVLYVATSPRVTRPHVFRTDNAGLSFVDITGDLPDRFPTDLSVDPTNDRRVFVTFGGFGTSHVFTSSDGGASWQDIGAGLPDVPTWAVTVDPAFPDHVYVGNDLGVYQSLDGGLSWTFLDTGYPDAAIAMDLKVSPTNRKLRVATHGHGAYERGLEPQATSTEPEPTLSTFTLEQNYPNPFRAQTTLAFTLKTPAEVTLAVYDISGREVARLIQGSQATGRHEVIFDAGDLASGTYIARMVMGDAIQSRPMVLVK